MAKFIERERRVIKPSVDVGNAWRQLMPHERLQAGDQYIVLHRVGFPWTKVDIGHGERVRTYRGYMFRRLKGVGSNYGQVN